MTKKSVGIPCPFLLFETWAIAPGAADGYILNNPHKH